MLSAEVNAGSFVTGWILSRFYVERAFSTEAKDFGDLIISDIKDQFITKLSSSEWMSEGVRKLGISKGKIRSNDSNVLIFMELFQCTTLDKRSATQQRLRTYAILKSSGIGTLRWIYLNQHS